MTLGVLQLSFWDRADRDTTIFAPFRNTVTDAVQPEEKNGTLTSGRQSPPRRPFSATAATTRAMTTDIDTSKSRWRDRAIRTLRTQRRATKTPQQGCQPFGPAAAPQSRHHSRAKTQCQRSLHRCSSGSLPCLPAGPVASARDLLLPTLAGLGPRLLAVLLIGVDSAFA